MASDHLQCPPALREGDIIAIIPTARFITEAELKDGIALAESWGLRVRLGSGIGKKDFQQAGTAQERAADLQAALEDPTVKAIWCARGGYGTVQLFEHLDLSILHRQPKWIVGFSDITALHSALHRLSIRSLHAQMAFNIAEKTPATKETLRAALFGEPYRIESPGSDPLARIGRAEGLLVGGNLSLLYALRGTPYDLDTRGKILVLEDLDELLYHVDRMVMNLKLGGLFTGLAGLIIGGMNDMRDKNEQDPFGSTAEQSIARAVGTRAVPVCFGFPVGHIADNRALVLGANVKLSVTPEGATLSFEEGGYA
jgi:muramoyltetrapeptide carboxypeptidase